MALKISDSDVEDIKFVVHSILLTVASTTLLLEFCYWDKGSINIIAQAQFTFNIQQHAL